MAYDTYLQSDGDRKIIIQNLGFESSVNCLNFYLHQIKKEIENNLE